MFPGLSDLISERRALLDTLALLPDDQIESGPTLCTGWAPRDVLAHLVGIDDAVGDYLRSGMRINAVNARVVEQWRQRDLGELLARAKEWAEQPSLTTRIGAWGLLGDLCVHHRDIVRGAGLDRPVPPYAGRAILREGVVLGVKRLRRYRVVPTDGGRAIGRGTEVRGTREQLGMWLAGRDSVHPELEFAS